MIVDSCNLTTPLSSCCGDVTTPFTGTQEVVISSIWDSPNFYNQTVINTYEQGRLISVSDPVNKLIFTAEVCPS